VGLGAAGGRHRPRVCAYDRAGSGWSDPRPEPRDAQHFAGELHALLHAADVPGPYILVGHSYGGKYVRLYAATYPGEVAGMVLVDASHPDQWTRTAEGQAEYRSFARLNTIAPLLARLGVLRLVNVFPRNPDLPAQQSAELKAFADSTRYAMINQAEFSASPAADAQVRATGPLGVLPLVVLTATDHGYAAAVAAGAAPAKLDALQAQERRWQAFQAELRALSTNSIQRVVSGADHGSLLLEQHDASVTSTAIIQIVEAVRSGQPLTQ
jgi:pimeloyl-ACP methyl ester carboxylesterase